MLVLLGISPVPAQESRSLPKIGVLWPGDVEPWNSSFFKGLREQGYIDGVSAELDIRKTNGNFGAGPALAQELIARDPAVIFVAPAALARHLLDAVRRSGKSIPIVVLSFDPVAEGVIPDPKNRQRKITGIGAAPEPELITKHLQLLRDVLPAISRVSLLVDATWDAGRFFGMKSKAALRKAGEQLAIRITSIDITAPEQLQPAFVEAARSKAQALIVPASPLFAGQRTEIIRLAAEYRIPAIYGAEVFPQEGGLMSYWTPVADVFERGAGMVAQILRGTQPGDIPVEYPTRFQLVVNLKTASTLGITLPQSVLIQAAEVLK
jgi:putative ABC transport system substrate-binding protein